MKNSSPSLEAIKQAARDRIADGAEGLFELSHQIHAHPELAFEEVRASHWLAEALGECAMEVRMGICELPTAFEATTGSGPLVVAICAEYDALPSIGHACGHNIIASSAVGAALALAPLADDLGITLKILGTPAEEGGGGKILMLQRGGFAGVHAAMMVHPGPYESIQLECLAVSHLKVSYHGRSSHAAGAPELGINAADAMTIAQVSIGLLRQHLPPGHRVHGIVTNGGQAANIVPEEVEGEFFVRAVSLEDLVPIEGRVRKCFEAGAVATGSSLQIEELSPPYSEFKADPGMACAYMRNAVKLGREFPPSNPALLMSTDMANVSLAIPAIHPMLAIGSLPAVNHQPEFARAAISPTGDQAIVDGAAAMAWTVIDLATTGERQRLVLNA